MSTIHRPAPIQTWWYAAGAVLAALVAVLAFTVLTNQTASPGTGTAPVTPVSHSGKTWHPGAACFATRPGATVDLAGVCSQRHP
jgi:hypothetical protein